MAADTINMTFIGDVHGKWRQYRNITRNLDYSLQLGDFGFQEHVYHSKYRDPERHKVIFGNHDNTRYLHYPHSMKNHGEWFGIFCVRGALSIDRQWRIEGVSWWSDEQLEYSEMMRALEDYEKAKPSIMATHDCPALVYPVFGYTPSKLCRTTSFFDNLFEIHKPDVWLFGHHHISTRQNIKGTEFICLSELETLDTEIQNGTIINGL